MRTAGLLTLCLLPTLAAAQPIHVLHRFEPSPAFPNGALIQTPDGGFYGVVDGGIYRLAPGGQVTVTPGPGHANGALVRGPDGGLYGATAYDDGKRGTVFRFDPVTLETRTLHVFSGANEEGRPLGGLVEVGGMLYGVTNLIAGTGSIFRLDPGSGTVTTVHLFSDTPAPAAWMPNGPLALAPDGRLYGTTFFSDGGHGAIYRYDPASGAFAIVHQFTDPEGNAPVGPLALDADGMLYGTATGGGGAEIAGTIFRFDPVSNAVTVLYALNPANGTDGRNPGPVTIAADGHLYGTTRHGNQVADAPTLFRLRRLPGPAYAYDTIGTVPGQTSAGELPSALTAGADGRLYGYAATGGPVDLGLVFRFDLPPAGPPPVQVALVVLHDFRPTTVYRPSAPARANDGLLYGTTVGGTNLNGAVYRLNPVTGAVTILGDLPAAFGGTSRVTNSSLVLGPDNLLYGTALSSLPGSFENRIIRVDPATGVATLPAYTVGALPANGYSFYSPLVRTPAGALYGLRYQSTGTQVFRFDPQANTVTDVASTTLTDVSSAAGRGGRSALRGHGPWFPGSGRHGATEPVRRRSPAREPHDRDPRERRRVRQVVGTSRCRDAGARA